MSFVASSVPSSVPSARALPVIPLDGLDAASRACGSCDGRCCSHYSVPLAGYDVVRLMRGLGLPWDVLATVEEHRIALAGGFRLDRGPVHPSFVLRRKPDTHPCQ